MIPDIDHFNFPFRLEDCDDGDKHLLLRINGTAIDERNVILTHDKGFMVFDKVLYYLHHKSGTIVYDLR